MRTFYQNGPGLNLSATSNLRKISTRLLRKVTISIFSCICGNLGIAQPISWDFDRDANAEFPSVNVANVSTSAISVVNNNGVTALLTNASASSGYPGASGKMNAGAAVPILAFNTASATCFEVTIIPEAGYSLKIQSINFGSRSTSTGPQRYSIRTSLDDFSSQQAGGQLMPDSKWYYIANSTLSIAATSAVTIRIYGFEGSGNPVKGVANWRIDDLSIQVSADRYIASYRTRQSGNWNSSVTWESSADNINWSVASSIPGKDDGPILIRKEHAVTINSPVSMDQAIVEGALEVASGGKVEINDGAGDDLTIGESARLVITTVSDFASTIMQSPTATIGVLGRGKIAIGNGAAVGNGYESFATSLQNHWSDASVFEYNSSNSFVIAGFTYFPNVAVDEVPVFRIVKVGNSIPAPVNKDFLLNAILEIQCDVTFTGAGRKNFRNGILGTATISQQGAGKFGLTGKSALLAGMPLKIVLSQPMDQSAETVVPTGSTVIIIGSNLGHSNALTINGILDMTTSNITNSLGPININGTYRTAHAGGFSGSGSSIPTDKNIFIAPGSTIEFYANADQKFAARKDFANLTFSGSGVKTPSGAFTPAGTVSIIENAIFDCSGRNIGDETSTGPSSTNLTMTDNSRLIVDSYGPNPKMAGKYDLRGGVIEFKNSGSTPQTVRSKNYQNIEITGSNVSMGEGNINLNSNGTFTVKKGAIFSINDNTIIGNGSGTQKVILEAGSLFKCGTNLGFNGAVVSSIPIRSSAINADIKIISLEKNSTIEYTRKGDQPISNANGLVYQNLILAGSGNKIAPPDDLMIEGDFSVTSNFVHNGGTTVFAGKALQTYNSTNSYTSFHNLINRNNKGIEVNAGIEVFRKLAFENNSLIVLNDDLTLKSSKDKTAFLSQVGTNVNVIYNKGRFVVERYINTNTKDGGHPKSWQHLATPAFGETIFDTWQEKGRTDISGYGTWITGPEGSAKGFDATSAAPSMKYYNSPANAFTGIPSTDAMLYNEKGYMVFIRGDRYSNTVTSPATPTVLRTRGKLFMPSSPPAPVTVMAKRFESVGNPYASAIDISKIIKQNVGDGFACWDASLGGDYGVGGYQTISAVTGYRPVPGNTALFQSSGDYRFVQSGQAVFFFNYSNSEGKILFPEECKVEDEHRSVTRISGRQNPVLFANLLNENKVVVDGNAMVLEENHATGDDRNDVPKMLNGNENFAIKAQGKRLTIQVRSDIEAADTIYYDLSNLKKKKYFLQFTPENIFADSKAFVVDNYLQTRWQLNLSDSSSFPFEVNDDSKSSAPDRLYVIFIPTEKKLKQFSLLQAVGVYENEVVKIQWHIENGESIERYQIEHSSDGQSFQNIGTIDANGNEEYQISHSNPCDGINYYKISAIKLDGSSELKTFEVIVHRRSTGSIQISSNPITNDVLTIAFNNQKPGNYNINVYNQHGQKIIHRQFYVSKYSDLKKIPIPAYYSTGFYAVVIIAADAKRTVLTFLK